MLAFYFTFFTVKTYASGGLGELTTLNLNSYVNDKCCLSQKLALK